MLSHNCHPIRRVQFVTMFMQSYANENYASIGCDDGWYVTIEKAI